MIYFTIENKENELEAISILKSYNIEVNDVKDTSNGGIRIHIDKITLDEVVTIQRLLFDL